MVIKEIRAMGEAFEAVPAMELVESEDPRQLSLVDGAALSAARKLNGFCTIKFDANLLTEGIDYASLRPEIRLSVGEAEIEISPFRKRCYPACPIRTAGSVCPLPAHVAFARTVKAGTVRPGDAIQMQAEEN